MAKILLMEPDNLLAKAYQKALQKAGHEVFWQTDAQTALGIIDEHQPELAVLELHLPNHNGIEFIYEIRSYPDCDVMPILLHTMVPPQHPGLGQKYWPQLGISDYLYKPQTSLAQLVERVNRLVVPTLVL